MADEILGVPPIVKRLSEEQGMLPWSWFIGEDYVSIVFTNGKKMRFDRPALVKSKPVSSPVIKIPSRSRRK